MIEAARLLVAPLNILIIGGPNIIAPRAAKAYGQGGVRALSSFVRRLAPLWIVPFILYGLVVVIAPTFWLKLFFGEKYSTAGLVVTLWVSAYVFSGVCQLPNLVLGAMRRPDIVLYVILPVGLSSIGLTGFSVHFFGVEWAVVGRIASELLGTGILGACAWILLKNANLQGSSRTGAR
jgi:O-antigen/teichoic acid export membrane protein